MAKVAHKVIALSKLLRTVTTAGKELRIRVTELAKEIETNQNTVETLQKKGESLGKSFDDIKKDISDNKAHDLILKMYENEKLGLLKYREEVISWLGKNNDRADAVEYGSFTFLAFIIPFNAFFYSYPPAPGSRISWVDFLCRLLLVILFSCVLHCFLNIVIEKVRIIEEHVSSLSKRYLKLCYTFKGLSMTGIKRSEELATLKIRAPNLYKEKIEPYAISNPYDSLESKDRIKAFESTEFEDIPVKTTVSTKLTKRYINIMMFLNAVSAFLMVLVCLSYLVYGTPSVHA